MAFSDVFRHGHRWILSTPLFKPSIILQGSSTSCCFSPRSDWAVSCLHIPQGSARRAYKGYEEVEVPALKPKPFADGEKLRKVSELPDWARGAFAGMASLNRVQSRVADCAMFSGENMLVCAPTGGWEGEMGLERTW